MTSHPKIVFATVRVSDRWSDIECRFEDGQKFAPIHIDEDFDDVAFQIAAMLNREARSEKP